jgi:hypothetical protein
MKKLYFLFFLTIGFLANAQIINFPDIEFKNKLLSANPTVSIAKDINSNNIKIDSNNNNEIEVAEALAVYYLDINNVGLNPTLNNYITNLSGLENFLNLEHFKATLNEIIEFNFVNLTNLKVLILNANSTLNLIELDGLVSLERFECLSCGNVTSLDFSSCISLNGIATSSSMIQYINLKNGKIEDTILLNNTLSYLCVDQDQVDIINNDLPHFGLENCNVNSYCSFTPGGISYEISGNTKLDSNNNGCDFSDINYPYLNFSITDGTNTGSLVANQTGNYYIPVSAGNHTITPNLENPTFFNVSPTNFTVNFPTQTSPFAQDFCVTANGVKHDVEVVLIPTVPARPGFNANYKLVYRNKGNQVENGSIFLTFDDSRLDYVAANPVYNSSATNSFTWNYSNLQPFETREIEIVFNVNSPMETPAVNNGDQLDFVAQITPFTNDEVQFDNISSLKQIVVGSYDPNDKTCIQGETIAPSEVGNYVHYLIRFENTGTYPAENIVVKDMIDLTKFDIVTLVPLKSSHDYFTRINGNKVEFIFENINLDFNNATNDGYVVFKIKTLPSLVLGDTFTNNANIYFDYNFPITTNTYTTTVAALSSQDFDFGTYFTLYPNPAKDVLNIQAKQDLTINSIEIYNQLGQIVMASTNTLNTIDVSNLASGTYFVKINTQKGSANSKFVKE